VKHEADALSVSFTM